MSAVGQIVAEGTHSRELSPRWEPDPHRETRGRQTPEREAAVGRRVVLHLNEDPSWLSTYKSCTGLYSSL